MSAWKRFRRLTTRVSHRISARTGLGFAGDRRAMTRAYRAGETPTTHLLIAPPGGGNIGDQAMVEAFLENTIGEVLILTRRPGEIRVPPEQAHRATAEAVPGLIYGDEAERRSAMTRYGELLSTALSVSVIGADIMDGAYNVRASARRADAARLARGRGIDARVLGFSWNGRADSGVTRALRRASAAGTRLLLRDPLSAERATADGLSNVEEVADLVFSARTSSAAVRDEVLAGIDGPYAVVNASGLVARSIDQATEYSAIVRGLLDAGLRVVLLPHVVRASADDSVACAAVAARVDDERVILIDRVISPAEVRGLCADARLVVTGRMHLAIQALWNRVPAITLSTQGKVEGLMKLFATADLCVEPQPGLAKEILPLVGRVLEARDDYVTRISERMPAVLALSQLNFRSLAPDDATVGALPDS